MSGEEAPAESPGKMEKDAAFRVYDQYWQHARHVENQLHSYFGFYVAVAAAALAFSAETGNEGRVVVAMFIFLLSIMGLAFNYQLRVPFTKLVYKGELMAINEFHLRREYRRFFDSDLNPVKDKLIDTYDVFAVLFIIGGVLSIGALMVFSAELAGGVPRIAELAAAAPTMLVAVVVFWWGKRWTAGQLNKFKQEIQDEGRRLLGKEAANRR